MTVKISRRDDRIRLLFAVNEPFHCDDVDSVALHCVHLATTFGIFVHRRVACSRRPYIDNTYIDDDNKRLASDHTCSEIRRCSLELWFSFSMAMI